MSSHFLPGRRAAAFVFALGVSQVWAQSSPVDITPPSAAQSLSCLQRPAKPLAYPEQHELDRTPGFMRVKLQFEQPDAPPKVEILANTARDDMQKLVLAHVKSYRLPCLKASDGSVVAVQEFQFSNSVLDSVPVAEAPQRAPSCVVLPPGHPPAIDKAKNRKNDAFEHAVLAITFNGTGTQEPELKLIYSTGASTLETAALDWAKSYRMPCRTGTEEPVVLRQQFTYVPYKQNMLAFKEEAFDLPKFLSMTEDIEKAEAHFDFNTMSCPFAVRYSIFGPSLPNVAEAEGVKDSNRTLFLNWLSQRQLAMPSQQAARKLFGTRLLVKVPCGVLNLNPSSS
ncbi:hypothetical protein ACG0Z6_04600 [Roseateles sp. BYS180W]|uniref:TonB C-terminal domain-containing protein n=1 Tax=Roseateles rivi TaxID=3299028 RepID=A0ABW7FTB1_9BURK